MNLMTFEQRRVRVKELLAATTYTHRWFIVQSYAKTIKDMIATYRIPSKEGKLSFLHSLCTNDLHLVNTWS